MSRKAENNNDDPVEVPGSLLALLHTSEGPARLLGSCMATHQKIAVIEEVVTRLEVRLFGNGQPGEIGNLKTRVTSLERSYWKFTGIMVAAVLAGKALMDWVAPVLLAHVARK